MEYLKAIEELHLAIRKGYESRDIYESLFRLNRRKYQTGRDTGYIDRTVAVLEETGYRNLPGFLYEYSKRHPEDPWAYREMGWIHNWHGRRRSALEHYIKLSELIPDDINTRLEISRLYRVLGEYHAARGEMEKVLSLDSENEDAHCEMGKVMAQETDFKGAFKEFSKALRVNKFNLKIQWEINQYIRSLHRPRGSLLKLVQDLPPDEFEPDLLSLFNDKREELAILLDNLPRHEFREWRYRSVSKEDGIILYLIVRLMRPSVIIETGTRSGTSTTYLAKGCRDNGKGRVITIDRTEDTGYLIPSELEPYITKYEGVDSMEILGKICLEEKNIDMFYHDSDHSCRHFCREISEVLPFMGRDGIIAAHDAVYDEKSPSPNVVDFFQRFSKKLRCRVFNTGSGLGVIRDNDGLKKILSRDILPGIRLY